MKKTICLLVWQCSLITAFAQKKPIDYESIRNWASQPGADITWDGAFSVYSYSENQKSQVIIKSLQDKRQWLFTDAMTPLVVGKTHTVVFERRDSIIFFDIDKGQILMKDTGIRPEQPDRISNYIVWNHKNKGISVWAGKGKPVFYPKAQGYKYLPLEKSLLLINKIDDTFDIRIMQLGSSTNRLLWQGKSYPEQLTVAPFTSSFAFITSEKGKPAAIWACTDLSEARQVSQPVPAPDTKGLLMAAISGFSKNGKFLFATITEKALPKPKLPDTAVLVNIWHYLDKDIQPRQLVNIKDQKPQLTGVLACDLESDKVQWVCKGEDEKLVPSGKTYPDKYVLIRSGFQRPDDMQLHEFVGGSFSLRLRDLTSGKDILIASEGHYQSMQISAGEKYVYYDDQQHKKSWLFDIAAGTKTDISSLIPEPTFNLLNESAQAGLFQSYGTGGWLPSDEGLFMYSRYDIWRLRFDGKPPICLTSGFGKARQTELRFMENQPGDEIGVRHLPAYWVQGVSTHNYDEGFGMLHLSSPWVSFPVTTTSHHIQWIRKTGNYYIMIRSNNTEASNHYISKDLRHFIPITDVLPQKDYRWYNKSLIHYNLSDGRMSKAIMYVPQDLDRQKKHPIIFSYYEQKTHLINVFETPEPGEGHGNIDPAWMCSRGYIVCLVDIDFVFGKPGESALDAVTSAAKHIRHNIPYVDVNRMAVSGASHGGTSTNYIVSRTNIFAAAVAAFGVTNMISSYGSFRAEDVSRQYLYETSQERMGGTPWTKPAEFIENTVIFRANQVTTPLLIQHNKGDKAVPFTQGLEWYMALRRCGKRVWMLEYENEGHGVDEERNIKDYYQRLEQFLDHYLKGAPAPVWMTRGIAAKDKGLKDGLEPDTTGSIP